MWGRKKKKRRGRSKGRWYDNCDCDCDLPCCDFGLLSTAMLLVGRVGPADRAVVAAIRGYRRGISPRIPVRCRYEPSCSTYGLEAVQRYGARRGLRLTAARLRRCRPGVPYGTIDPVP
jgi:putative membrane protein insertion efficiency factor